MITAYEVMCKSSFAGATPVLIWSSNASSNNRYIPRPSITSNCSNSMLASVVVGGGGSQPSNVGSALSALGGFENLPEQAVRPRLVYWAL